MPHGQHPLGGRDSCAGRQRALRGLYHIACEFVALVKSALFETRVNVFILGSFVGKLCWLIPMLANPRMFEAFPSYYSPFEQAAPQWAWAATTAALALFDVWAARHLDLRWQAAGLLVGFWSWWFLSRVSYQGLPHGQLGLPAGPTFYFYAVGCLVCLVGLIRLTVEYGAHQEALALLRVRRMVDEELRSGALREALPHQRAVSPDDLPPTLLSAH